MFRNTPNCQNVDSKLKDRENISKSEITVKLLTPGPYLEGPKMLSHRIETWETQGWEILLL